MTEKKPVGRPPSNVKKVMNSGRQPTSGVPRSFLEKMGLIPDYLQGEVFFKWELKLDSKNPLNSEIRLIHFVPVTREDGKHEKEVEA